MEWESQAWEPTGLGAHEQLVDRDSGPEGNEEQEALKAGACGSKYLKVMSQFVGTIRSLWLVSGTSASAAGSHPVKVPFCLLK